MSSAFFLNLWHRFRADLDDSPVIADSQNAQGSGEVFDVEEGSDSGSGPVLNTCKDY
jgi:hypothetical protein